MRVKNAFWILLLLFVIGCDSRESRLIGTWKVEVVQPPSMPGSLMQPNASQGPLRSGMLVTFAKDQRFTVEPKVTIPGGFYKWDKEELSLITDLSGVLPPLKLHYNEDRSLLVSEAMVGGKPAITLNKVKR